MKVPVSTTLTCVPATAKPASTTNLSTTLHTQTSTPSSIEPSSVPDIKRNPSPATKPPLETENNNGPPSVDLDNLEAWDSILSELGLNDDNNPSNPNNPKLLLSSHISPPRSQPLITQLLPDFPSSQPFDHTASLSTDYSSPFPDLSYTPTLNNSFQPFDQQNTNTLTLDFLDDLLHAAQAFESNDSHQLHVLLSRLNQRLRSPVGKPLERAAFYFKEALQHLSDGPDSVRAVKLSSYDIVQTIHATKAFSVISPISLSSAFAANQAVLEAVDGASFIHIVDFDIGFGGHWSSFMRELGGLNPAKLASIVLRITAIVPEEFGVESKLVRENLSQFASELNLNFHIDFVLLPTFETLSFNCIKFMDGERIAVHLTPSVLHCFANNSRSGISKFVTELRTLSPSVVVVVDKEVGIDVGTMSSLGASFVAGIEFYTGMMEALDIAVAGGFNRGVDCVMKIEKYVLRPRIVAAVEAAARVVGRRSTTWREAFTLAGMKVVGFSQFADFQAECLLRRAQVSGFHVAKRYGEMMLFWHDRPLVATSAWKF